MPAQSASPGHCWRVCDEGFFAVTDSRIVLFGRCITARSGSPCQAACSRQNTLPPLSTRDTVNT